jgi:hypothetical protein
MATPKRPRPRIKQDRMPWKHTACIMLCTHIIVLVKFREMATRVRGVVRDRTRANCLDGTSK